MLVCASFPLGLQTLVLLFTRASSPFRLGFGYLLISHFCSSVDMVMRGFRNSFSFDVFGRL